MLSSSLKNSFLFFVRLGIGHTASGLPGQLDWSGVHALADAQGLSAVVLEGTDRFFRSGHLSPEFDMDRTLKKQWIGQVIENYEYRYERYRRALAELAGFYNAHGFKMMVLKGYACSLDWPKPVHRPSGDIDIWQFGKQKEADAALVFEKGISLDSSHHHHTVFWWRGYMVENHYDFINVHHHRSNVAYEKLLKELGKDDSCQVDLCGEKVYLPSPDLHALFLLRHTMLHFASEEITLRHVLDWGFFVKAHGADIDWPMVQDVMERFGMKPMFGILNCICVEDLGFEKDLFPGTHCDLLLKERVLNETLSPEFTGAAPSSLIPRLAFKYRRWRANAWKHRLCYKESLWSAFWSGAWNHFLKPSSI